jgi:hypothetical protein
MYPTIWLSMLAREQARFGPSPPHIPSYQEHAAMDAIRGDPNLRATPRMILKLLQKGWIETCTDDGVGGQEYQLTSLEYKALKAKVQT